MSIERHLDAFQEAIGNSSQISDRDAAHLNASINQLRLDARHAMNRHHRVDPGHDETARQAKIQNGADGGYLPVRRALADGRSC